MAQAQRIVDKTMQVMVLGMRLRDVSGADACLLLTPDMKTLELELTGEGDTEQKKRRVPVSEVVDASFGSGDRVLVLRFSNAMAVEPFELCFADERQRVEVALALKVLRARHGQLANAPS